MNIKEIKEILNLMREHGLSEIELEKEGIKLKLKKQVSGQIVTEAYHPAPAVMIPSASEAKLSARSAAPEKAETAQPADGTILVRSPMVGTFYSAPAPDQPAYVTAGQTIKEGDVLCIIEAMKLMNEIKSDVSGVVEQVLVKNGDALEFDQPLFRIRKA